MPTSEKKKVSRVGVYGVALQQDQILLVTQKHGPYANKYDLPGGGIEFGESVEETLRREFLEEVSMTFSTMQFFENLTVTIDYFHQIGLIYSVTNTEVQPEHFSSEFLENRWVSLASLSQDQLSPFGWKVILKLRGH